MRLNHKTSKVMHFSRDPQNGGGATYRLMGCCSHSQSHNVMKEGRGSHTWVS